MCLFSTVEKTLDSLAFEKAEGDNRERVLREEIAFFKRVVDRVKKVYMDMEMIKDDIRESYEIGADDGE